MKRIVTPAELQAEIRRRTKHLEPPYRAIVEMLSLYGTLRGWSVDTEKKSQFVIDRGRAVVLFLERRGILQ